MNIYPFVWVSIAILALVAEVGHPGLFLFLPFAFAAGCTAFAAVWTESLAIQGMCFLLSSIISFIVVHRWIKKRILKTSKEHKTTIDALIGQKAVVINTIEHNSPGYVQLNGKKWLARSQQGILIEKNSSVIIVAVRGAHVIVQKVNN